MTIILCFVFAACGENDDEFDEEGESSGSVTVTAVQGSKRSAHYSYKITVKYSGNDAKYCGVSYGKTSGMSERKTHTGSGSHTFSCDFYTGSTYYYQGFVKTTSGKTLTSKKKSVRVK